MSAFSDLVAAIPNLRFAYPLGGTTDVGPSGLTLTAVGSPTTAAGPVTGDNASVFNGTSQHFTRADDAAFDFGTSDYTLFAWIKPTSISTGGASRFICGHSGEGTLDSWEMWHADGSLHSRIGGLTVSASNVLDLSWQFVAVVMDRDGNGRWWRNFDWAAAGTDISSVSGQSMSNTDTFYIANRPSNNRFNGQIAWVGGATTALTDAELKALALAGPTVSMLSTVENIRTGTDDPWTITGITIDDACKGLTFAAVHGTSSTDHIAGVVLSNSGTGYSQTLRRGATAADTATEPGRTDVWFAQKDIPPGSDYTLTVDLTSGTGDDFAGWITQYGSSSGRRVIPMSYGTIATDTGNPSISVNVGEWIALRMCVAYSGAAAPSSLTPNANLFAVHDHDFGNFAARIDRGVIAATGSVSVGYTSSSDDLAMVAWGMVPLADEFEELVLDTGTLTRGFWPQRETTGSTFYDFSGFGRAGTYTNSPTLNQASVMPSGLGKSVLFNGTDEYGNIPNASAFTFLDNAELSLLLCLQPVSGEGIPFSKASGSQFDWAFVRENSGSLQDWYGQVWQTGGANRGVVLPDSQDYLDGDPAILILTLDETPDSGKLYTNGTVGAETTSWTGSSSSTTSPVRIGNRGDNTSYNNSYIGPVAIWSGVVTQAEVDALVALWTGSEHYDATATGALEVAGDVTVGGTARGQAVDGALEVTSDATHTGAHATSPSGALALGSDATTASARSASVSASLSLSASASVSGGHASAPQAGLILGSDATHSGAHATSPSGAIEVTGDVTNGSARAQAVAGALEVAADATNATARAASVSGGLVIDGSVTATQGAESHDATATGALVIDGDVTATTARVHAPAGALAIDGDTTHASARAATLDAALAVDSDATHSTTRAVTTDAALGIGAASDHTTARAVTVSGGLVISGTPSVAGSIVVEGGLVISGDVTHGTNRAAQVDAALALGVALTGRKVARVDLAALLEAGASLTATHAGSARPSGALGLSSDTTTVAAHATSPSGALAIAGVITASPGGRTRGVTTARTSGATAARTRADTAARSQGTTASRSRGATSARGS
jgi:hypothetical protein